MKILMLDNEYPPLGGGQGSEHYFLNKEFANKKYGNLKIDNIISSANKYYEDKTKIGTDYYLDINKGDKNPHFQSVWDLITYSVKSLYLSLKLNKKNKYDLIVTWSGLPSGFLGYVINKIQGTPYIVLLRGSDVPFYEKRWHFLDTTIFSWLSPIVWRNSSKTSANSSGLRTQALSVDNNAKIEVIYNGIDIKFYSPKAKTESKTKIIFGVGRLIPRKGFNYLIQAIGLMKEEDIELWIAGGGPEEKNLKELSKLLGVENKVKFLGEVERKDLSKLYQKSDIFCLPSLNEGMSNAILEAMASGIPIVSTDTPGANELIKGKGTGFIVKKENPESLKEKLLILMNNAKLRKEMGMKARKLTEKLSFENIAEEYYKLFEGIKK